jgi:hypothetical protein
VYWVVWKNARRAFFHTTQYTRRAPQARAGGSFGKKKDDLCSNKK